MGKIARLPAAVREELNRRLDNGDLGKDILPWLNALPDVKRILAEQFTSRLVTQQNLSEWRKGGFQDWLCEQSRRKRLLEIAAGFSDPGSHDLETQIQERLVEELAEQLERLSAITDRAERFKCLLRVSREFCRVQRSRNRGLEVGLLQAKTCQAIQSRSEAIFKESKLLQPFPTKNHGGEGGKP